MQRIILLNDGIDKKKIHNTANVSGFNKTNYAKGGQYAAQINAELNKAETWLDQYCPNWDIIFKI